MHAPASITHGLALALFVMPAVAASALAVPVPAPQLVVIDGNQQLVVPRAEPKLPGDAELAQVRVDPELVRLARELDAQSFVERRAARDAIAARKPAPDELMALLLRTDLGDEARHQLVGILRNRILTSPRGALGIRMENAAERDGGVRVTGLVPGMPAEKVLKPGDILKQVNDSVLRHTVDLVNSVQSLPPGVEIRVVVKRVRADALAEKGPARPPAKAPRAEDPPPGAPPDIHEEITVSLRLGSTEELQEKGEPLVGGLGGNIRGGGVIVGGQVVGGGMITFERVATAQAAAKRFLPQPASVPFPAREKAEAERKPATVDSVRALLMGLQLAEGDPDLVRTLRSRLDALAVQMERVSDPAMNTKLQQALDALEEEIRSAM
jgi:hypothetical protein